MHADLHNNVYDENDKPMLRTLRPIIDLRSLALKIKENSTAHVATLDGIEFTRVMKQLATNIVDGADAEFSNSVLRVDQEA